MGNLLGSVYRAPFALLVGVGVVIGFITYGQAAIVTALDQHVQLQIKAAVDSPERIAQRSEMLEKHAQYERMIADQGGRIAALERSGNEQTLTLNTIRVTLERVQKDVSEIRDEQRAAREFATQPSRRR